MTDSGRERSSLHDMVAPVLIAGAAVVLTVAFHGRYGYFRDELYYIACSSHLAFGYVDQPPLSIALLALWRLIAGDSLQAIRFLSSLALGGTVVMTALTARRMGGGPFALGLSAFAVVAAHGILGGASIFSMNPIDIFFWIVILYLAVRILAGDSQRLWIPLGIAAGLGIMNKYSVGFLCAGLAGGLLLTPHRAHLARRWLWLGVIASCIIVLPHVLWEYAHGFPTLEFMRNASQMKNAPVHPGDFLLGQFRIMNYCSAPLWLLGLWFFFAHGEGKRFRSLGWMYVIVLAVMMAGNGKLYYMVAAYPVLFAGGAVALEGLAVRPPWRALRPMAFVLPGCTAAFALPLVLPVLPVEEFIAYEKYFGLMPKAEERTAVGDLPQVYADQFGWEEFVGQVARIYATLTPEERSQCVIFVRNYGEAGAVDFFGGRYGLPPALCAHNNYWMWGPGERTGNVAIIVGHDRGMEDNLRDLRRRYASVEPAGATSCAHCMPYENGRLLFLCRGMNTTFQALWPTERFFI